MCEWFVPNEREPATGAGVCKRNPPVIMWVPVPQQNLAGDVSMGVNILGTCWPNVLPVHFCGEHKAVSYSAILKS